VIDSHSSPVSDQAAFTALCQEWWAAVVQDALAVLGDRDAAEDVAQIVFTRLWVSGRWRQIEHASTYFTRAAGHEAHRLRARWRRLGECFETPDPKVNPLTTAWRGEVRQAFTPALASLPPRCRRVMNLSLCHGWTRREIADHLEISVNGVEKQRTRGLKLLRQWFEARGRTTAWGVSSLEDVGG
jgi:RNA polymerase sigma factor (sigma-70 family)